MTEKLAKDKAEALAKVKAEADSAHIRMVQEQKEHEAVKSKLEKQIAEAKAVEEKKKA